jgi:RNA polymerase sigma-70 factor (ECF subfamily)
VGSNHLMEFFYHDLPTMDSPDSAMTRLSQTAAAFFDASRRGDLQSLSQLLARDVILQSDGGKVLAFRNPILGLARVARLYRGLMRKYRVPPTSSFRPLQIDHRAGHRERIDRAR